ncbi:MAG TPA: sugar ABC transporter substrate-binding protein [Clostridiales bacterium]|nr:sugar ABC transporter substrate-binding protein [Clostridiales bacterium]
MKKLLSICLMIGLLISLAACATPATTAPTTAPDTTTTQGSTTPAETTVPKSPKTISFLSMWAEEHENSKLVMDLTSEYQKDYPEFKVEFEMVPSTDLIQKLQLYFATQETPELFATGGDIKALIKTGELLNISETFGELGIMNIFDEAALQFDISKGGQDDLYTIPMGMNIEGFWYNKKIFTENNIAVPATWDELFTISEALLAKGIQPLVVGGKDRWPITRYLYAYIMRDMGPDALIKARAGTVAFTDPAFARAAQNLVTMVNKGYFGQGINSLDLSSTVSMFFNGQSAMIYNGSWFVADLNNPEKNILGEDGVGFFPVPTVAGGKGKITDYNVNTGNSLALSAKKYDAQVGDWARFVFTQLGQKAMDEYGALKGYKVTYDEAKLKPYTKLLFAEMKKIEGTGFWFEFGFDTTTTQLALNNGQLLVLGEISPEDYFKQIGDSWAANRTDK